MSKTPQTDAAERIENDFGDGNAVSADFARTLETQRDEARAELAKVKNELSFTEYAASSAFDGVQDDLFKAEAEVEMLRKALDERSFRAGWDARDANYGNLCPPTVEEVWLQQQLEGGGQIGINDPQRVDTEQKEVVTFSPTQPKIFEAHGREWYAATISAIPPVPKKTRVDVLFFSGIMVTDEPASAWQWGWFEGVSPEGTSLIKAWRPSDAPEKLPRK